MIEITEMLYNYIMHWMADGVTASLLNWKRKAMTPFYPNLNDGTMSTLMHAYSHTVRCLQYSKNGLCLVLYQILNHSPHTVSTSSTLYLECIMLFKLSPLGNFQTLRFHSRLIGTLALPYAWDCSYMYLPTWSSGGLNWGIKWPIFDLVLYTCMVVLPISESRWSTKYSGSVAGCFENNFQDHSRCYICIWNKFLKYAREIGPFSNPNT